MDRSLLRLADGPCPLSFEAPRAHERAHDSGGRPASFAKAPRGLDPEWRPDSIGVAGFLVERFSKTRASPRPEFPERSVNVRGEVHAYLPPEHYRRLKLEAAARRVSLSQCVGECLGEYFALRQEMATALETPDQTGDLSRRVIHVLLAETEQRLVATFERHVDDLAAVRGGVDALLAMSDRAEFLALCQTPEVPPAAQGRALASGQRRFAHWRQTVARMLLASGRPVPWPLAEPEPASNLVPKGAQAHAGVDDPGTASLLRPMRPDGRPEGQGDPQPLRSATPLDRPEHEGSRGAPGGPDRPLDQAPVGTGLRARLTRLVGWRREPAAESSRRP
jgi:hypothetical protein